MNYCVVQVEIVHRREQELLKFKKDAELAITTAESNEATLKKRFQEQLNEVNEQLERANKAKTKYVSASSSSFDDLTITVCPVPSIESFGKVVLCRYFFVQLHLNKSK